MCCDNRCVEWYNAEQTRDADVQHKYGEQVYRGAEHSERRSRQPLLMPKRRHRRNKTEPGGGLIMDRGEGLIGVQVELEGQTLREEHQDGKVYLKASEPVQETKVRRDG